MRHRLAFPAFLFAFVFLLSLAGCWNPFKPDENGNGNGNGGGEILERTSPENVLNNLKVIYSEKDEIVNTADDAHYWAEKYRELFDLTPAVFKFYFVFQETPPNFPEGYWFVEDEVLSFEGLLNSVASEDIVQIDLEFTIVAAVKDNRVDEYGQPLHPGWKWIHVPSVLLDVDFSDGNIMRVAGASADFYFGPDPSNPDLWVITEWFDREAPAS
ncbi:MAG: hypothetical protein AMJ46_02480 [Latescibacteria bacterium DG_63]|nr:MAG: hypothetical protein AMJ46_02480 [Latescibacteria bacterium DG_63]